MVANPWILKNFKKIKNQNSIKLLQPNLKKP